MLKEDKNESLWPYKMPMPILKEHRMMARPQANDNLGSTKKNFELKIMSYNILADRYMN